MRWGTVLFCADHTRTPNLLAEDRSVRLWEGCRVGNAVAKMPSPKGRGGRSSSSSRGAAARCFAPGTPWEKRAVTRIGAEVRSLTFSYKWCISVTCSRCTAGKEHWWYSRITQESPQGCEAGTRQVLCWASLPSAAAGSSLRAPALALALWFHGDSALLQCSPVHSCQPCGTSCSCCGVTLLPAALLGMPSQRKLCCCCSLVAWQWGYWMLCLPAETVPLHE